MVNKIDAFEQKYAYVKTLVISSYFIVIQLFLSKQT